MYREVKWTMRILTTRSTRNALDVAIDERNGVCFADAGPEAEGVGVVIRNHPCSGLVGLWAGGEYNRFG
jgi:hypothetical protein